MAKVDAAIVKETKFIALIVLVLSALMEAVFLIIGKWDLSVLLGNLLGGAVGVLNFFLMGLGLQKALDKEAKDARATVSFSHTMRNILLAAVIVASIFVPFLNTISTIVSLFFASLGVYIKVLVLKKNGGNEA